jgi:hypothetical protein
VLGPYKVRVRVGGEQYMAETLPTLENAAADLGGRTLADLPPTMEAMAPQIRGADRLVFFTKSGIMKHRLTAQEMQMIIMDPALRAKTTFVKGGLPE